MASNFELLIFDGEGVPAGTPAAARVLVLPCGLSLIPVTGALVAGLPGGRERVREGWILKQAVCDRAREMSVGRRVSYLHGATWAGPGCQEAMVWQDGEIVFGPTGTCDLESDLEPGYRVAPHDERAINLALRVMGVRRTAERDEYAVAGLTRHRFTDHWLADADVGARPGRDTL